MSTPSLEAMMAQQRYLTQVDMNTIVSLAKRRGFVFPSSEVYGGIGSTWDYGPLGVELKRNVKEAWWRSLVDERDDVVGLDAAILMHPQVWVASGHAEGFTDPLVECTSCNQRFRPDQALVAALYGHTTDDGIVGYVSSLSEADLALKLAKLGHEHGFDSSTAKLDKRPFQEFINDRGSIPCPFCETRGKFSDPRTFSLMLKTFLGPVEDSANQVWLRPETAQGIFVNFENVLTATRMKLPFGIAQIGKSFRNEITPGNFIFRTREFEQMEMEFFVKPGEDERWHQHWVEARYQWYLERGIRADHLRIRPHDKDELAHYAKGCSDIEYLFPFGWSELEGIANRTDFDLRRHSEFSGHELKYFDQEANEHYYPYVIEPSGGVDRSALAFLVDAYDEEPDKDGTRVVLRLHPDLAPVQVAVLPLSRNAKLVPAAREVHAQLRKHFATQYDDAQSIGRRYRRQDEVGTPLCVTVDFQTVEDDQAVTIRGRDTMAQIRVPVAELVPAVREQLEAMTGRARA